MNGSIACIVVAGPNRNDLLDELVIPSILGQGFDECVVVGQYHSGEGYRHLPVPAVYNSTLDGLIKREVGAVATSSSLIVYLNDDHRLEPGFCTALRNASPRIRQVGVPLRFTVRDNERIPLNMGLPSYCGGHSGVYHRTGIQEVPWSIAPHHRLWDVWHSQMLMSRGYELVELPDCMIEDVEGGEPWR